MKFTLNSHISRQKRDQASRIEKRKLVMATEFYKGENNKNVSNENNTEPLQLQGVNNNSQTENNSEKNEPSLMLETETYQETTQETHSHN